MMREIALVGLGAGGGGIFRFLLNLVIQSEKYPWATTFVNLSGSFLLGIVATVWAKEHPLRLLLGVGVLGGYTTFSTFSVEVVEQIKRGEVGLACLNMALQVVGSAGLCAIGMMLAGKLKQ